MELEPGLDGLVHISQCALKRIAKVEDAVQVGQTVRVKVLKVDKEAKRISLSIREALTEELITTPRCRVWTLTIWATLRPTTLSNPNRRRIKTPHGFARAAFLLKGQKDIWKACLHRSSVLN